MHSGILFQDVQSRLGNRDVLDHLDLEIPRGRVSVILGRSGVGKSVMLKHIVGLLKPLSGKIWLDQVEITQLSDAGLWPLRRKCSLVFQHPALLDSLTVEENILLGVHRQHFSEKEKEAHVDHCLGLVNLSPTIRALSPHDLSFGMQKRVSIARAIATEPQYLLYDEPTTGLDPANSAAIDRLICHLTDELHVTSVVVTHDIESALEIADIIALLEKGRISFRGSADQFEDSDHPTVREFLKNIPQRSKGR